MEVTIDNIEVMFVPAEDGPRGAREAFNKLESKLPTLKGRKFYGTFHHGEYRACVAITEEDNPDAMGLHRWVIPGGKYAKRKIKGWENKVYILGEIFNSMIREHRPDPDRPSIEFYRSQKELILLLPIR